MSRMKIPNIRLYLRKDILPGDLFKYQADIVSDLFDHHGVGTTPSEALLNATMHWHNHDYERARSQ